MWIDQLVSGGILFGALATVVCVLRDSGFRTRQLTPIVLFVVVDVTATWYVLLPGISTIGLVPGLIAAASLVLAAVTYRVSIHGARDTRLFVSANEVEREDVRRSLAQGYILIGLLAAVAVVEHGGLPPFGSVLSTLANPSENADAVSAVREFRRESTKSHYFGGEYRGQGAIRALVEVGWRHALLLVFIPSWMVISRAPLSRLGRILIMATAAALAALVLASTGIRSVLVLCLVVIAIAYSNQTRVSAAQLGKTALIGAAILLAISPLSKGSKAGETIPERAGYMAERVLSGNGQNNVTIIELVNSGAMEFGRGAVFVERSLAVLPGARGESAPFAHRVAEISGVAGSTATGYSTPTHFGLLYADLGYFGVVAGYIFTGLFLGGFARFMASRPANTPQKMALYAQVILALGYWAVTGIQGAITAIGIALALHIVVGRLPVGLGVPQSQRAHG